MDVTGHEQKVHSVATAVREYASSRRPGEFFSLHKAAVPHLIPNPGDPKHRDRKISIFELSQVLEVDRQDRFCVAEPGVTFDALVRETLKYDLVPLIVPELKTITVGGAVAGGAVESMSFRHGTFHDSCLEYELVTGAGQVITCSPWKDPEIFGMVHSSFGTLGVLTRLKFRLLPAAPFVRVDYVHFPSLDATMEAVQEHFKSRDVDFMDGVIHSPRDFVLCLGRFAAEAPYTHTYLRDIYYQSTRSRETDYLTTYDYLFRYERDGFWTSRNYGLENRLLRLLTSPFSIGSTEMLSLARRFPFLVRGSSEVAADAMIPIEKMKVFFGWYLEMFNYFPLWILPLRMERPYPWINPDFMGTITDPLHIECGVYGFRHDGRKNYYRLLEEQVFELKGVKALISYNYYSESAFWKIFDKKRYQSVKETTDPQNLFRDVYQKTCLNVADGAPEKA